MGQQRPTPEQIQAFRAQTQAPDLRNDLLNLARGVDPTFGFLSGMLPEPEREDPMLQLAAGLIPIGLPAKALAGIRSLLVGDKVGEALAKAGGLMRWGDAGREIREDSEALKVIQEAMDTELGISPANLDDAWDILRMLGQDVNDRVLDRIAPRSSSVAREWVESARHSPPRISSETSVSEDELRAAIQRERSTRTSGSGQSSFLAASETPDWVSMLRRSSDEGAFTRGQVERMMQGSSPVEFSPALTRLLQGAAVLGGAITDNPWVGIAARQTGGMLAGTVNELRKVKRDREEQR